MPEQRLLRMQATATGHVQGVGFRNFVQRQAGLLGCVGYVSNDADGVSVLVVAEGSEEELRHLLRALERGPRGAQVRSVEALWSEGTATFTTFSIRY